MNYLTNYYKNLSEQLQHRANVLENQIRSINESLGSYGQAAARPRGAFGYAGGPGGQQQAYSGQQLGSFLGNVGPGGQGMNFANDYLSQYGGGMQSSNMGVAGPAAVSSGRPTSNRNRPRGIAGQAEGAATSSRFGNPESAGPRVNYPGVYGDAGPGAPRPNSVASRPTSMGPEEAPVNPGIPGDLNGDGRVDGADLGMQLGQGANTSNVLQNWSIPYSQQGPAFSQAGPGLGAASNRPREAFGYAGGPGGQQQAYSGQQLGSMLGNVGPGGQGMNFANDYLSQYGGGMPSSNTGVEGPAAMQTMMNRARSARRGAGRSATGR
jgi:hypothetical protein